MTVNHGPLSLKAAVPATIFVLSIGFVFFAMARRSRWFNTLFPERAVAWLVLVQAIFLIPLKNGAIHNAVFLPLICLGFLCLTISVRDLAIPARIMELPGRIKNLSAKRFQILLMLLSLSLGLAVAYGLYRQTPYIIDETVYLFQAKIFAHNMLAAPVPGPAEFFYLPNLVRTNDAWSIQQAPGWPALLSLGVRAGTGWIVNPVLGALTALIAYRIGREAVSESAGRLAGILSLGSPLVVFMNGSIMAHPASALFLGLALLAGLIWARTGSVRAAAVFGLALGLGATIRPYSAFLYGVPLGIWVAYYLIKDTRRRLLSVAVIVGAMAAGSVFLVLYNHALHGSALVFGYDLTHGEVELLGFGQKYFPEPFTPIEAIRVLWLRLTTLSRTLWALPVPPLFFVLLPFLMPKPGLRQELLAGIVVSLALGHMYYFFIEQSHPPRFLFAAWPPLLVLAASGIMAGADRLSRLEEGVRMWLSRGAALAIIFCVLINLPLHAPFYVSAFAGGPHLKRAVKNIADKKPLVFVAPFHYEMGISLMDPVRLEDGPIFVRDLKERNREILKLYPQRRAYRFYNRPFKGFILEPYQ